MQNKISNKKQSIDHCCPNHASPVRRQIDRSQDLPVLDFGKSERRLWQSLQETYRQWVAVDGHSGKEFVFVLTVPSTCSFIMTNSEPESDDAPGGTSSPSEKNDIDTISNHDPISISNSDRFCPHATSSIRYRNRLDFESNFRLANRWSTGYRCAYDNQIDARPTHDLLSTRLSTRIPVLQMIENNVFCT